jgi:hypothetical protein
MGDDLYTIQLGNYVRIKSRKKAAEDMARGRAEKDRTDPSWRSRCHVSAEWSAADREEQSRKLKELWTKPEFDELKEAARQRALRLRAEGKLVGTQANHEHHAQRMRTQWRHVMSFRKAFTPEAIAAREQRNLDIVRAYYLEGMKPRDISTKFSLEISRVYKVIRETPLV